MIASNLFPYDVAKYREAFFAFYKTAIMKEVKRHHKGEDLHGDSYVLYNTAKHKAVYIWFSLLKFDITTTEQDLYYFKEKYDIVTFADTLIGAGFNINDLLTIFEIDETILTVEA